VSESRLAVRRSPLAHREPLAGHTGSPRLAEVPFIGKFILRADPQEVADRLRTVFGIGLPVEPLTSSTVLETALLWMGPDEWMLCTAPDKAADRSRTARDALAGIRHQLVDVSDYYTVIELAGAEARPLLMKLTTLDLHPRAFPAGMVAGSVFGRANATLWQTRADKDESGPVFRLFIRWSMADYLWCILAEAGREWGVPEQIPVKGETLTIG
jgi:sarcosine oxidase, subunit gamma